MCTLAFPKSKTNDHESVTRVLTTIVTVSSKAKEHTINLLTINFVDYRLIQKMFLQLHINNPCNVTQDSVMFAKHSG